LVLGIGIGIGITLALAMAMAMVNVNGSQCQQWHNGDVLLSGVPAENPDEWGWHGVSTGLASG
jgi:hypothetical protein